nr:hypothetical protein [Tanacetum cinerariifolium]
MCRSNVTLMTALISNGPNSHGLGCLSFCQPQATSAPSGNSSVSHLQSTTAAWETGPPLPIRYLKIAGIHSTTASTRRLCPAATLLRMAPL